MCQCGGIMNKNITWDVAPTCSNEHGNSMKFWWNKVMVVKQWYRNHPHIWMVYDGVNSILKNGTFGDGLPWFHSHHSTMKSWNFGDQFSILRQVHGWVWGLERHGCHPFTRYSKTGNHLDRVEGSVCVFSRNIIGTSSDLQMWKNRSQKVIQICGPRKQQANLQDSQACIGCREIWWGCSFLVGLFRLWCLSYTVGFLYPLVI